MTSGDFWARVGRLFDQALGVADGERARFIDAAAESDEVKAEVRSLLAAHDATDGFLEIPETPLTPGGRVGPYLVRREVGRGGMGIVYEAEDTRLHRRVALKALPPALASEASQRRRLRQEARAAAALQHPGIATVFALEEIDGHLFIASEFLEGRTLRDEMGDGALPPWRALGILVEMARAVCAAHERGIVHRDLKPENVVRTLDGTLKVLDFGLAQFGEAAHDLASRSRVTESGWLAGTPAYMAPEQLLGRGTDFRADHFALGVMLYELCTGTHPFGGTSLPSTIARVLAAPPAAPPAGVMDARVWAIVERCLEKDPARRFEATRDLLAALEAAQAAVAPAPRSAQAVTAALDDSAFSAQRAPDVRIRALTWWRFHQLAAALAYWAMVWPAWHVHRSLGRAGLTFFFAVLAAVVVAATLRLHLWFSSRVYPEHLSALRADVSRYIRWADVGFAALLVVGGIALPEDRAGWAALLISYGVGAAVAFVFIEPATSRAAFPG